MNFEIMVKSVTWDTEVDGVITSPDLPTGNFTIQVGVFDDTIIEELDDEIGDALCDALSDEYGYCVYDVEWDYA